LEQKEDELLDEEHLEAERELVGKALTKLAKVSPRLASNDTDVSRRTTC
jgi:hypothetical protein